MKKILLLMFCMIFLIGNVSSADWDNVLDYENNDLTVKVTNWFGLFGWLGLDDEIGTAELKSHSYVTQTKKVGAGNQVVMWYDFDFTELYENGLGDVEFTDEKTGEEIDRNYSFVYWGEEEYDSPIITCGKETNESGTFDKCTQTGTEKATREKWLPYDSEDIPEGKIRLGLMTYVEVDDKVDGVWTIAGKKVKKHAIWTAQLNVDLIAYWKMDEGTGTNASDNVSGLNGFVNASALWRAGKIGSSFFGNSSQTITVSPYAINLSNSNGATFGGWVNSTDITFGDAGMMLQPPAPGSTGFRLLMNSNTLTCRYSNLTTTISVTATATAENNTWYNVYCSLNSTNFNIYVDGVLNNTVDAIGSIALATENVLYVGGDGVALNNWKGHLDEMSIWNRSLIDAEFFQIYNGGAGISFTTDFTNIPTSTINAPANLTTVFNPSVVFNATGTDNNVLQNMSLIVNGTRVVTNTSVINNTLTQFPYTLTDVGFWNFTVEACDDEDLCVNATLRGITFANNLAITLNAPVNTFNSTSQTILFNGTGIDDTAIANISMIINESYNGTNSSVFNNTLTQFSRTLADGFYNWTMETCDAFACENATARNFSIDSTFPVINITFPLAISDYHLGSDVNETLNWTATDDNLDTCFYDYNFANNTVTCNVNETNFTLTAQRNITFYANDTFGNYISDVQEWIYRVLENSQTFNNETIEGVLETFVINITLDSGESIEGINFNYNGTDRSASQVSLGDDMFNLTSTFTIPSVPADVNHSFFWIIDLASGQVNTSANNQTVRNIGIDNCSTHTTVIFNYTMVDEETQTQLVGNESNTSVEVDVEIFNLDKSVSVINFSTLYNQTNPVAVCLSINLTNETIYALDSTVKYEASGYAIEYYNIQNFTLDNSSIPQEITLFDLLTADSTEFQITFKDSDFVVVEDALIQINRQYVSEGLFKTVEIPITDSNGQTVAHLVEKDIKYNIIVSKEGLILGTFNNVIAFCEDVVIGSCFISLNALEAKEKIFDYDDKIGLFSSFDYNETTRILQFDFSTTDGSVKNVSLSSIKLDQLGNTSVCDTFLVSASGSLFCTVANSIGNETIIVSIFVDGDLKITNYVSAGTEFDIGDMGYFLMFFLVLSLALMMTQSKIGVIIGVVLGFISSSVLSLFKGGIMGVGSSILWLIIMGLILIWKLNSQRQT